VPKIEEGDASEMLYICCLGFKMVQFKFTILYYTHYSCVQRVNET